jgi:hypothetical protein
MICAAAVPLAFALVAGGASAGPSNPARPADCQELVVNGGFEDGHAGWVEHSKLGDPLLDPFYPRTGDVGAWLGAKNNAEDSLTQPLTLPAGAGNITLSFWWAVYSEEAPGHAFDNARSEILRADGAVLTTTLTIDNDSSEPWLWNQSTADLTAYAGQTVQFRLESENDAESPSSFFFDDVSIVACAQSGTPTPTPTATATARRLPAFLPVILR